MGPKEWTAALSAALERVPLRRRPEVRAVRVTPGGYRVILHHNELTHRLLMQALLDRAEVTRMLQSWDAAHGPLELCFTFGGDSLHEAEEMITVDSRGVRALDPQKSRHRLDALTDEGPEAWFRRMTGAALPFSLPREMARCDVATWETPGASEAFGGLPKAPVLLDNPGELTILGHYGAASQNGPSIYYIASEGPHYAFLRLHFGGVYGSADQDRRYVTAYLRGYARFRDRTRPRLSRSILIHNVGSTSLRVSFAGAADDDLIEIPCSSWKEAEEALDAHLEEGSGAA